MFNGIYQYNFPTTIRFGDGAVAELPAYLISQGLKAPLIVTDPTVAGLIVVQKAFRPAEFPRSVAAVAKDPLNDWSDHAA